MTMTWDERQEMGRMVRELARGVAHTSLDIRDDYVKDKDYFAIHITNADHGNTVTEFIEAPMTEDELMAFMEGMLKDLQKKGRRTRRYNAMEKKLHF